MTNPTHNLHISIIAIFALSVAGCGGNPGAQDEVSETVLGDIDVLDGSVSDDMINVDEFDDENPASTPDSPAEASGDETPENAENGAASSDSPANQPASAAPPRPATDSNENDNSESADADTGV